MLSYLGNAIFQKLGIIVKLFLQTKRSYKVTLQKSFTGITVIVTDFQKIIFEVTFEKPVLNEC